MTVPTNQALIDALLQYGRAETPADLAARGVQRVRSVSLKRVSKMIEQAINLTIMERTLGVGELESELILRTARERFERLLDAGRALGSSRADLGQERADLERELTALRDGTLAVQDEESRQRARREAETRRAARVVAALGKEFSAVHAKLPAEARGELRELERRLVDFCLTMLREECDRAVAAEILARDQRVEVLERRVAKLVVSLRSAEEALERVQALGHVDAGIESIYRTVQGLSVDDKSVEKKRALLADIFEANVELRAHFNASLDGASKVDGASGAESEVVLSPAPPHAPPSAHEPTQAPAERPREG